MICNNKLDTIRRVVYGKSPFSDLQIAKFQETQGQERQVCPQCGHKRRYFCCDCILVLGDSWAPEVSLPVNVHIVKHPGEKSSKSTAIHACLLAPKNVKLHSYPEIPTFEDNSRVLLLFPSPEAQLLEKVDRSSFDHVVFIDSTWIQASGMLKAEALQNFRKVKIVAKQTAFWRYQTNLPDSCLATLEAIYYFFREYHTAYENSIKYDGRYDNLFYYFQHQYETIQKSYLKNSKPHKSLIENN
eukprot:Sdes_comp20554_c0_seq1m15324